MIRDEAPGDAPAVRVVNEEAFGSPLEAGIVDALRAACPDRLSLVAEHVSLHKGRVWVEDCPDGAEGARFVVELPVAWT